jgi:hypothetical protein
LQGLAGFLEAAQATAKPRKRRSNPHEQEKNGAGAAERKVRVLTIS